MQRPWTTGLGWILALIALLGCLLVAFVGGVTIVHVELWLIGLVALAIVAG